MKNKSKSKSNKSNKSKAKNKPNAFKSFFETVKDINIANKLTILRILLTPVFVVFLVADTSNPYFILTALIVFSIGAITDFLDGYFARTRLLVTELGKFLDPIADKILVMSALVGFVSLGWIAGWTVIVILARDFIVSGVRLISVQSDEKLVIPARASGKVKTAITMTTIISLLFLWTLAAFGILTYEIEVTDKMTGVTTILSNAGHILRPIGNAFMYICVALTVYSGIEYIWDARSILKKQLSK
jgi:CDP-diacylglycerol--glycerol-3-phosphate 3-phosphatidyltransferase